MVEYNTVNANLSDLQLYKLENAVKDKQETTLRMKARMFNRNNLPHELLLTRSQTTKVRNTIENNMSTDINWLFIEQTSWSINESSRFKCKKCLAPLGIPAALSTIDGSIQTQKTWFWKSNVNNFK